MERRCTILLTGDFHGKLDDKAAALIDEMHRRDENSLLLDAGDAVEAGNLAPGEPNSPILIKMSKLGYDAMVMGNRESHPFRKLLEQKLTAAKFPVLAANLMAKRQPAPKKVHEYLLKTLPNGLRVAVIGLTVQITPPKSWWSHVTDYVFDAPEKTAVGLIPKVRPEADFLIILSHCGLATDKKLAKIEGVDLVLGGHSHVELFEKEDGAPIFHTGYFGHKIGRVEVNFAWAKVSKIEAELSQLSEPKPGRPGRRH